VFVMSASGGRLPGNVPETCHPNVREIVEYWIRIHPESGLPGRQHLDPLEVPRLLPNIRLLDVAGLPPRFRIRLMGTRLRDFFGAELTGRWMDDVFSNLLGSLTHTELLRTIETKEPRWRRGTPALKIEKDFFDMERVYLPFARDGQTIDMILTYLLCIDGRGNYS
jgi:PAS domain